MIVNASSLSALVVAIILISTPAFSAQQDDSNQPNHSSQGGHTIIMEQFTATWCDICATIDPWLPDWADARGSRITRIALHDTFDDPLGNPVTTHRLSRFATPNPAAPSFWFDGDNEIVGGVSQADLDLALLSAESLRSSDSILSISTYSGVSSDGQETIQIEVELSEVYFEDNSQISGFILRDSSILSEQALNGITEHHDVIVGYAEAALNTEVISFNYGLHSGRMASQQSNFKMIITFQIDFEHQDELTIVGVHELIQRNDEMSTLGATSLTLDDQSNASSRVPLWFPLSLVLILSALALRARSRR